jgi:predicted amidohydrolase YtcJ
VDPHDHQLAGTPPGRTPYAHRRRLDQATDRHPVLVKRGGHNDVLNSYALRLAGITEDTPVPAGGVIGRDDDGRLNGRLIDNALVLVERLVPAEGRARRIDGLRLASGRYAATGTGTVRDCAVSLDDYAVLLAAREAGALSTRVRALISAIGLSGAAQVEELLDAMEDWRYGTGPWLGVRGVKFALDGGLEAGATEGPYACGHAFSGTLTWEPDALAEAVEAVVRRGWRVGTHTNVCCVPVPACPPAPSSWNTAAWPAPTSEPAPSHWASP